MSTSAAPAAAAHRVPAAHGWRWIVDAWTLTAGERVLFVVLVTTLIVLGMVGDAIPVVGPFGVALFAPALTAGVVIACDALQRGERLRFEHLFAGFERERKKLLALGVVFALASLLLTTLGDLIAGPGDLEAQLEMFQGVLLGGATPDLLVLRDLLLRFLLATLIVLAGSVPLYMTLWFAIPLVALRGADVVPALKTSFTACVENAVPFLVWSVPQLLLAIVVAVPLMIAIATRSLLLGLVGVTPLLLGGLSMAALTFASIYTSYRDVFVSGD